ncbi:MAG TPA: glycosyltransferase family 39 protein, partial [Candidatus Limnocylindrales bacterium]|nr:glycosyltransferase family 39 protein [Candidatus Limnocylindrales bacterium]
MLVVLLPAAYLLLAAAFWRGCGGRRAALVWAALTFAALLFALTEGLSRFVGLTTTSTAIAWLAVVVVLAVIVWRWRPRAQPPAPVQLDRMEWGMLALLDVFLAILTVIALAAPPNTYDSLTYHMSRVMHWVQNGSVDFYPTAVTRQLYQHPLAEYGILHLQLLAGTDQFANLIQLAAYALGMAAVSLITRELGGKTRAQIVSAVLFGTLPMAILQATSTATDLVTALWVAVFVWFCLRGIRSGLTWPVILGVGMSLGLALTTKGTAYVFVTPFALWLGVAAILRHSVRAMLYGAVIIVVALMFPLAHFTRNLAASGS